MYIEGINNIQENTLTIAGNNLSRCHSPDACILLTGLNSMPHPEKKINRKGDLT